MGTVPRRPGFLKQILKTKELKSRIIHSFYYSNINLLSVCLLGASNWVRCCGSSASRGSWFSRGAWHETNHPSDKYKTCNWGQGGKHWVLGQDVTGRSGLDEELCRSLLEKIIFNLQDERVSEAKSEARLFAWWEAMQRFGGQKDVGAAEKPTRPVVIGG